MKSVADGSLAAQGDCVPEVLLTDLRVGLSGEIVEDVRKTRSTSHIGTYVTAVVTKVDCPVIVGGQAPVCLCAILRSEDSFLLDLLKFRMTPLPSLYCHGHAQALLGVTV